MAGILGATGVYPSSLCVQVKPDSVSPLSPRDSGNMITDLTWRDHQIVNCLLDDWLGIVKAVSRVKFKRYRS